MKPRERGRLTEALPPLGFDPVGLAFEHVLAIGVHAAAHAPRAREHVSGQEERAEALVLPHVNPLVHPRPLELECVRAYDYVTERDRGDAVTHEGIATQGEARPATVGLQDALQGRDLATREPRDSAKHQPDQGVGQRP